MPKTQSDLHVEKIKVIINNDEQNDDNSEI